MVEWPYLPPLKAHYERILYPLDIFEREEQKKMQLVKEEQEKEVKKEENGNTEQQKEYKPHNIPRLEMRKLSTFYFLRFPLLVTVVSKHLLALLAISS